MQIQGIILLGTSMDYESERSRNLGCWDADASLTPVINVWATNEQTADFKPDPNLTTFLIDAGFGKAFSDERRIFWQRSIESRYQGDDGRRRLRMVTINLRDRDGLEGRLFDVRCPVTWLHGNDDAVYSVANAEKEISMFTNAKSADLVVVPGGVHFLNASHPKEVAEAWMFFISKWY